MCVDYSVSSSTFYRWLTIKRISLGKKRKKRTLIKKKDELKIEELLHKGASLEQMGREVGVSGNTVRCWLKKKGLKTYCQTHKNSENRYMKFK